MRTLSRVGVFVEMRAVELCKAVSVAREMRGSPIENDADAGLVAAVDEFHELSGRAVAAGGGEIAESLGAPGPVVGMLHDGKQLDVSVAEVFDVGDELAGKFAVIQPAIEVANDTDAASAGSPNGEVNAVNAFEGDNVSAEFFVSVVVAAFAHEMQVELSQHARKCVGVVDFVGLAEVSASADFVGCRRGRTGLARRPGGFEEAFGAELDGVGDYGGSGRCSLSSWKAYGD